MATRLEGALKPEVKVRSVVEVQDRTLEDEEARKRVAEIVEGIHRDYDGVVIRSDVPPKLLVPKVPRAMMKG